MHHSPTPYTSHPRPAPFSRKARSYFTLNPPFLTKSQSKDNSSWGSKYAATSLGRSSKISHHLFPFISKFEALDALSHGVDIPSLRPAPLQLSRHTSPRRGGTTGPASATFDFVFSPRRGTQSRYDGMFSTNGMVSDAEDMVMPGTIKKSGSGKLKQTQLPYKVSNIRLRDGAQQSYPYLADLKVDHYGKKVRARTEASKQVVKGGRENSVVNERIKFYDGCMEHSFLSAACPSLRDSNSAHGSPLRATTALNTNERASLYHMVAPITPQIHKPNCTHGNGAQASSSPSTAGRSNTKTISTKSGTPQTPTKFYSAYNSKRRKRFTQNVPNPFLQTPHTNPPTRHVSPKTTLMRRKPEKLELLDRQLLEVTKLPDPAKKNVSPEEIRGRFRMQGPLVKTASPVALERRKANDKLEALYRAKSLERPGDSTTGRRGSNNQEMEMLRERCVVGKIFESGPWSVSKAICTRIPRPTRGDFSNTTPLAPLPKVPQTSTTKSTAGCKSVPEPQQLDGTRIPSLRRREQVYPSPPQESCRGIQDKIKGWESKGESKGTYREEQMDLMPKKANNLFAFRKSIFENPWNEEVGNELQKRGLDGQEVQAIVNEFQDIGNESDIDPSRAKWKMVVAPRMGRGGLTAQKDGSDDESGDMDMRIIVREAQCGLEEPKPLRLLEMKRMILLCRERQVGIPVYKDRDGQRIK